MRDSGCRRLVATGPDCQFAAFETGRDLDRAIERDPHLDRGLNNPVERPRPDAADLDHRLRGPATTIGNTDFFLVITWKLCVVEATSAA
jgi:hypothetical protein